MNSPIHSPEPACTVERTLCILKPDAIARDLVNNINEMIAQAGLTVVAQKQCHLTIQDAEAFYDIHKERPFFADLCKNMVMGPVVVQVLEGENAIAQYRDLMGATNPEQAEKDTIRQRYGQSIDFNTVHGSDSKDTAALEIKFFFPNGV